MEKPSAEIIRKELFDYLTPKLAELGFKYIKSVDGYKRNLKSRIDIIKFLFHHYHIGGNATIIQPWISIEEKSIARLYKKYSAWDKQLISSKTESIGGKMTKIYELDDYAPDNKDFGNVEWVIEKESDMRIIQPMIMDALYIIALPYFEKYGNLNAIERILNDTSQELTKHCSLNPLRFSHGLIAAKLLNKDNFGDLQIYYNNYLTSKDVPNQWMEDFNSISKKMNKP
jgi:hypothetical protein